MSWNLADSEGAATWISASESVPSLSTSAADQWLVDRTEESLLLSEPIDAELWLDELGVAADEVEFDWSWSAGADVEAEFD